MVVFRFVLYTILTILTLLTIYFLIGFWQYRSYTAFSRQLYNYFSKHCDKRKDGVVELHKITNFEWDHAYFFRKDNENTIQKLTKLDIKFDPSYPKDDTKVVFIKDHKIVKTGYIISGVINKYQVKFSLFSNVMWIYINFWSLEPLDPKEKMKGFVITYYDLQPNNDKLLMNYTHFLPSWGSYSSSLNERYSIYPTNMQQIHITKSN